MTAALTDTDTWTTAPDGPVDGEPRTPTLMRSFLGKINNRARWTYNRLAALLGTWKRIETAEPTGNNLTITGHGIASNTLVRVASVGGSVPTGLSETSVYYVIVVDANTIQVSASSGPGGAVDFTSAGSGDLYLYSVADAGTALFGPALGSLPAGTLNTKLAYLRDNWGKLAAANTWGGLQTLSAGGLTFSGITSWSGVKWRYEDGLADATQTIQFGTQDEYVLAAPGGVRTYTVAITAPVPPDGARLRIGRPAAGANDILIERTGAALIATLPASTACQVDLIVRGGVVRGSFASVGATIEASW